MIVKTIKANIDSIFIPKKLTILTIHNFMSNQIKKQC